MCKLSVCWNPFAIVPYRHDATAEIWQETYLSAVLRSVLYSDDPNYSLQGYRRLDPIPTPEAELRFLEAAEALFHKGVFACLALSVQTLAVVDRMATRIRS